MKLSQITRRLVLLSLPFFASVVLAETATPENGSDEIWSKPEVTADPQPNPPPPATTNSNTAPSDEIWSRPEPGHSRDEAGPGELTSPPPPYYGEPPRRYMRRRHYSQGPDSGEPLTELGLTLGPPTIINANIGFWGSKDFPALIRMSGMYYGDTRGIQVDVGYVISRELNFRQYVALSGVSWQAATNYYSFWDNSQVSSYKDVFYGFGPSYGLNWFGLSLQIGLAMGQDINTRTYNAGYIYPYSTTTTVNQFQPNVIFQIGYTFLF